MSARGRGSQAVSDGVVSWYRHGGTQYGWRIERSGTPRQWSYQVVSHASWGYSVGRTVHGEYQNTRAAKDAVETMIRAEHGEG